MKISFLADPINQFIKNHDSTWALMQAAFKLGHQVYYTETENLCLENNQPNANFIELTGEFFADQETNESKLITLNKNLNHQESKINLDQFDMVFMRKDPPVDALYLHQLQILSLCKKTKVINDASALLCFNEKLAIFNFPKLIAPTLVSSNKAEIKDFLKTHKKIVIKPLDGKGGEAVFIVEEGDLNLNSIVEILSKRADGKLKPIMAQKYIPEIKSQGDKRIILFNGSVAGAMLRVPSKEDHRANLAAGGNYQKYSLTKRDLEICSELKDFLIENKIYFAGIDVIGDYLTEINITSPTCLQEINRLEGFTGNDKIEYKLFAGLNF